MKQIPVWTMGFSIIYSAAPKPAKKIMKKLLSDLPSLGPLVPMETVEGSQ